MVMAGAFAVAAGLDRIVAIRRRLNYKEKVEKAINAAVRETDRFDLTLASDLKKMARDSRGVTLGEKDLRQSIEKLAAEVDSLNIKIEEALERIKNPEEEMARFDAVRSEVDKEIAQGEGHISSLKRDFYRFSGALRSALEVMSISEERGEEVDPDFLARVNIEVEEFLSVIGERRLTGAFRGSGVEGLIRALDGFDVNSWSRTRGMELRDGKLRIGRCRNRLVTSLPESEPVAGLVQKVENDMSAYSGGTGGSVSVGGGQTIVRNQLAARREQRRVGGSGRRRNDAERGA
ncbi:hypothetical protein [Thermobifida halotolerans]|nr:hypothetical protein [Thermobifida halotolerans]